MWVMARSYASPRFIGYEIKVNRQDFLRDVKWQDYLPYCTEFYFVAPAGIIDPTEVPEQAGLLVASKNVKRLMTKKKAPVRDVEIPASILIYILMSRTRVVGDMFQTTPKTEIWQDWLKQLKSDKRLGYTLGHKITERVDREVKAIKARNGELVEENNRLQDVKNWLEKKGVSLNDVTMRHGVRYDKLGEILSGLPYGFVDDVKRAQQNLHSLLKELDR